MSPETLFFKSILVCFEIKNKFYEIEFVITVHFRKPVVFIITADSGWQK